MLKKRSVHVSSQPGSHFCHDAEAPKFECTCVPNKEEKVLCHIAMLTKFLDENKLKIHLKSKFALF